MLFLIFVAYGRHVRETDNSSAVLVSFDLSSISKLPKKIYLY